MSTNESKRAPVRGGALYEVTCLRCGASPRTATEADFFTVRVRAPNALSARLIARNERDDCGCAFDAKIVAADVRVIAADAKAYVAIIDGKRIATTAAVIEHYQRAFRQLPVQFLPADADEASEVPE